MKVAHDAEAQSPIPKMQTSHWQFMKLLADLLKAKNAVLDGPFLEQLADELRQSVLKILKREKPNDKVQAFLQKATDKDFGMTVAEKLHLVWEDAIRDYVDGEFRPVRNAWILTLTLDGKLYRHSKERYCYSIEKPSQRLRILQVLFEKDGYVNSRILQEEVGSTSFASLADNISSINKKAEGQLKLPRKHKLIMGKKGVGYCLNPFYETNEE